MSNDNNNKQNQLQLELPQEVAQGEYANFAIITHSSSDLHECYPVCRRHR